MVNFQIQPLNFTLLNYHISQKNTRVFNYFLTTLPGVGLIKTLLFFLEIEK